MSDQNPQADGQIAAGPAPQGRGGVAQQAKVRRPEWLEADLEDLTADRVQCRIEFQVSCSKGAF